MKPDPGRQFETWPPFKVPQTKASSSGGIPLLVDPSDLAGNTCGLFNALVFNV